MFVARLRIAIVGSLCSLAALLQAAAPATADVVVIDNRTPNEMRFSLERPGGSPSQYLLQPGQVLPLLLEGKAEAVFQSEGVARRRALQTNAIYSFWSLPGGVDLEKTNFPANGQPPHAPAGERPAANGPADRKPPDFKPSRVIPLKILVDEEQMAAREKWEKDLRRTIQAASDVIERHCGLRFEVQSVDTWQSDNRAAGPYPLLQDFEAKVDPRPAWLAIGFTAQQRAPRGRGERHPARLFARHIVMRDWAPKSDEAERVELLVHVLGHYLGAVDSPEPTSAMRPLSGDYRARAQAFPLQFDAINTLILNLVAKQVRTAGPADWKDLPPRLKRQLSILWSAVDEVPLAAAEPRRRAQPAKRNLPAASRFSAEFVDGTRISGEALHDWGRTADKPLLGDRSLLDGPRPVRWLRADDLKAPAAPPAFVEFVGGDRVPGKVVRFRAAEDRDLAALSESKTFAPALPGHLTVEMAAGSIMHYASERPEIRVRVPWLRRIVWQRSGPDRYQPGTLRRRSGGIATFRSLQFTARGVKLLSEAGLEQIAFREIAELHLPAVDPWQAYYEQLAVLSPDGRSRLVRWETTGGLRVTASGERFQAFGGASEVPDDWIHLLQPAWSLDPLFVRHLAIRVRSYFLPSEVPLSILEPVSSQRTAVFSGAWDWRIDRNCRGGALRSGREEFAWGLGVHATSQLQFELPEFAVALRTQIGLDRLAGRGGCARGLIFVDSKAEPPLFRSQLLIGSRQVQDSGPLPLAPRENASTESTSRRRLILLADMAAGGDDRPSGADPLDVRDAVDWLEPLLQLDPQRLQEEVDRQGPRRIDAWAGWKLVEGGLRLVNRWDKSNARHPSYRLEVQPKGRQLSLTRSWRVSSITNRLLLDVSRDRGSPPSQIEVLVNGQRIKRFTVPPAGAKSTPGQSIALGKYLGQKIAVQVNQISGGERSQVDWRTLCVVD